MPRSALISCRRQYAADYAMPHIERVFRAGAAAMLPPAVVLSQDFCAAAPPCPCLRLPRCLLIFLPDYSSTEYSSSPGGSKGGGGQQAAARQRGTEAGGASASAYGEEQAMRAERPFSGA